MGRKKAAEIRKLFRPHPTQDAQICIVCESVLSGQNITNMGRHIEKKHSAQYLSIRMASETLTVQKSKHALQSISVKTSESLIWEGCIEMATAGGSPLSFISSPGFQKILSPIAEKLNVQKKFNVPNLKERIIETADSIKYDIKQDVKQCLISLKIDSVTRLCRSLIGINIQYIKNHAICIKTLAIKELNSRHTGDYLRIVIKDVLREYGISLKQIYSITSDNGRNMIKATQLLQGDLQLELQPDSDDDDDDDTDQTDETLEIHRILEPDCSHMVNCIRWAFMLEYLNVYRPIKVATLQLQARNLIFGDFYKQWLQLKIDVQKIVSPLAETVYAAIQRRESNLLENPVIVTALFLDPRFRFLLSEEKNSEAKQHLKKLYDYTSSLELQRIPPPDIETQGLRQRTNDEYDLSAYLNQQEALQEHEAFNYRQKCFAEIDNYRPDRIRDHTCDILNYWKVSENQYPALHKLAMIILAVPATQVSVERSFSALKLILSDERNRLSSQSLDNILLVKLNFDF